jgi:hypothetical protein
MKYLSDVSLGSLQPTVTVAAVTPGLTLMLGVPPRLSHVLMKLSSDSLTLDNASSATLFYSAFSKFSKTSITDSSVAAFSTVAIQ